MTPKETATAYAEVHAALQSIYNVRDRLRDVENTNDVITFSGNLFANLAYISRELRDHIRMLEIEIENPLAGRGREERSSDDEQRQLWQRDKSIQTRTQ